MAGFRANTNRCGALPSLAGGQAHPRGSLVSGASDQAGKLVCRQVCSVAVFKMRPRRLAPRAPHSFPRRGAAEYASRQTGSRLISRPIHFRDSESDNRLNANELGIRGCTASERHSPWADNRIRPSDRTIQYTSPKNARANHALKSINCKTTPNQCGQSLVRCAAQSLIAATIRSKNRPAGIAAMRYVNGPPNIA
jgi:hypothetical protein